MNPVLPLPIYVVCFLSLSLSLTRCPSAASESGASTHVSHPSHRVCVANITHCVCGSQYNSLCVWQPIWGVTAQNEPLTQTGMWGSNFYTAQNETDFIVNHLSPTLRRAYPHIKIMSHDGIHYTLTVH